MVTPAASLVVRRFVPVVARLAVLVIGGLPEPLTVVVILMITTSVTLRVPKFTITVYGAGAGLTVIVPAFPPA
jgi:hypothetical protein